MSSPSCQRMMSGSEDGLACGYMEFIVDASCLASFNFKFNFKCIIEKIDSDHINIGLNNSINQILKMQTFETGFRLAVDWDWWESLCWRHHGQIKNYEMNNDRPWCRCKWIIENRMEADSTYARLCTGCDLSFSLLLDSHSLLHLFRFCRAAAACTCSPFLLLFSTFASVRSLCLYFSTLV